MGHSDASRSTYEYGAVTLAFAEPSLSRPFRGAFAHRVFDGVHLLPACRLCTLICIDLMIYILGFLMLFKSNDALLNMANMSNSLKRLPDDFSAFYASAICICL